MTNLALHRALLLRRLPQFAIADDQLAVSGKFSPGAATASWTISSKSFRSHKPKSNKTPPPGAVSLA